MLQVIEVKVRLHCKACEKAVRNALCKIKGVTCVEIDVKLNKVTVMGYVDRKVVIKAVWKTGRRAELRQLQPSSSSSKSSSPCHPRLRLREEEEHRHRGFGCFNMIRRCKWLLS